MRIDNVLKKVYNFITYLKGGDKMTSKEWFKQAKFGLFIHWGLYSVIGGEWKGKRTVGYGDWAQQVFRIPIKEYERLATIFNPTYFDAEEWVKLAKNAGMQYIVFTAKHHEGFAMFHSKVDKFNIVDATPFKRDVVKELAEACYKYGLKFGVYYSQEIDWHERNGGGWTRGETASAGNIVKCYWVNNWDFPEDDKKDFSQYFNEKSKLQVKELLTNYGELSILWFDTPHTIKLEQSKELFEMVKKYQPNCLMNSRIGNGMGDFRSMKDNQIPDEFMGDEL